MIRRFNNYDFIYIGILYLLNSNSGGKQMETLNYCRIFFNEWKYDKQFFSEFYTMEFLNAQNINTTKVSVSIECDYY